jgi:hypothetical protein
MDQEFEAWVETVLPSPEPDEGGAVGHLAAGTKDLLRELFDTHGPISMQALRQPWNERLMSLTRTGTKLFRADLERTTSLRPVIEVWWSDEIGTPVASYNGNYTTPPVFSIRAPEALCEVADNLRDHVMDDLGTVWPVCPDDGFALDPRPVDQSASWCCRRGVHTVGPIGELPAIGPHAYG